MNGWTEIAQIMTVSGVFFFFARLFLYQDPSAVACKQNAYISRNPVKENINGKL